MAIEYPSELPFPLRQDYALQTTSPLQRTEMDSGRSRSRRRFASVPITASVAWLLTTPQAQIFESWYKEEIADGAAWFDCPLKTPYGLLDYEARFTDIYSGPMLVGVSGWRYTAQIEIRERKVIDSDLWKLAPDLLAGSGLFDKFINAVWPKHNGD